MNYEKIYNSLILKRQINKLTKNDAGEIHHIKMKSIFPELAKDQTNLVKLTYREHFIAHKLLFKIYLNTKFESSATYAFWQMCFCKKDNKYNIKKTSKSFEIEKRQAKHAISNSLSGIKRKPLSIETKNKIRMKLKGKKFSNEIRAKMSKAHKGKAPNNKGKPRSKCANDKLSKTNKGKIHCTNGILNKFCFEQNMPNGWWKGLTNKSKSGPKPKKLKVIKRL